MSHIYTKTDQQQQSMHTQKQRQKARVTGSSSRMIEVCACLSSELFRVAALSEHAPDEVSQGVERTVITGRLEGRSIRQTALRGVRHTRRTCLHVSGPGYSHRFGPCWQTDISQGPLSFSLCVLFPPFLSGVLRPTGEQRGVREGAPLTGLLKYLCWQGKDKNVIFNKACFHINTCSDSATHMKHLLPKPPPPSLELV